MAFFTDKINRLFARLSAYQAPGYFPLEEKSSGRSPNRAALNGRKWGLRLVSSSAPVRSLPFFRLQVNAPGPSLAPPLPEKLRLYEIAGGQ